MPDPDAALDDEFGDELLRLIFTACHPRLSREARTALALKMICGLTTEEIARAFLQPEATIAQRIVRAKRTLSDSGLAYETPRGDQLSERLASVLEVVYLIFNEGYTAARGDEWLRPQLCNDALRMGRVLTLVAPQEAEAHGLLALMELNASRIAARTDAAGDPILLMDQNRMRWDRLQIRRGLSALARAHELGGGQGFYGLQAAIVACHARAATPDDTDWPRIAELYAELSAKGVDVLYDDTDQRAGAKFAAADLIGIPWQIMIGPKGLADGKVEIKRRSDGARETMSPADAVARLAG